MSLPPDSRVVRTYDCVSDSVMSDGDSCLSYESVRVRTSVRGQVLRFRTVGGARRLRKRAKPLSRVNDSSQCNSGLTML